MTPANRIKVSALLVAIDDAPQHSPAQSRVDGSAPPLPRDGASNCAGGAEVVPGGFFHGGAVQHGEGTTR
jgi:hypothetical protein